MSRVLQTANRALPRVGPVVGFRPAADPDLGQAAGDPEGFGGGAERGMVVVEVVNVGVDDTAVVLLEKRLKLGGGEARAFGTSGRGGWLRG